MILEQMPSRGFQSSVDNILHFGLGKTNMIDSLIVKWPNNKYEIVKDIKTDTLITLLSTSAITLPKPPVIALSQSSAGLLIPSHGGVAPPERNIHIKTSGGGAGVGYFTSVQPRLQPFTMKIHSSTSISNVLFQKCSPQKVLQLP